MPQYDDLPPGAEVVGYSDLPPGAEVVPAAPPKPVYNPQSEEEIKAGLAKLDDRGPWGPLSVPAFKEYASTLGREAGAIASIPSGIYHAFADPETPEEQSIRQSKEAGGNIQPNDPLSRGLMRTVGEPLSIAADWYKQVVQGKIPNVYDQSLSVAPEAIGSGTGAVLLNKIVSSGLNAAARSVEPMTPETAMTLIRKGVLPKNPKFMENLKRNLADISQAEQQGQPVTTKAGFRDLLETTATRYRQTYESILRPHEDVTIRSQTIKGYQGETLGDEAQSATLRQLDNRLNIINNTIRDAKAGVGGTPLSTESIAPLKAEASQIRKVLYPKLQQLSGVDPAPVHAKMGQFNEMAREVTKSEIARFNQINRPVDAPSVTKSGLTSTLAGKVQRSVMGDPQDAAIMRAFRGLRIQH